jgi:hypothetical protein
MTHQATADNAYFSPTHLCLPHSLLRGTSERPERWSTSSIRQGSKVMPILLWIAFWSSMTGIASGWQETMLPIRVKGKDRRDQSNE